MSILHLDRKALQEYTVLPRQVFQSALCSLARQLALSDSLQALSCNVWSNSTMEKASYMNMQYLLFLKESVFSHQINVCMEMASDIDF